MRTRRRFVRALNPLFAAALLVVSLGAAPWRPIQVVPAAQAGAALPQGLLNPDGTLDLSGWEATLDGERGPVLKRHLEGSRHTDGMGGVT